MAEKDGSGTVNICIRMDKGVKKDAERLFSELGINMTTAVSIFLRRCIMENRIPFEVGLTKAPERTKHENIVSGEMTFEELCDVVAPIAAEHKVRRMYLFGSRARGDNRKDSDFDFCIETPEGFSLFDLGGLMYDLKDALGADVDLVSEDSISKKPNLMEEIIRDRKLVFEA